jgi:hypothetical protein
MIRCMFHQSESIQFHHNKSQKKKKKKKKNNNNNFLANNGYKTHQEKGKEQDKRNTETAIIPL